ncbi:MAG: twin-arginine translocase subunit TatB [Halioglobus sp.]|nr:twin-arginine translocase subunit TatB [Halioglobus sp.]
MFDIGFAELVIIGIVALLVIGPERLPSAVRTASLWINRIRRGFNEIKAEVQQELHNDSVMQELKKTGEQLKDDTQAIAEDVRASAEKLAEPVADLTETTDPVPEKKAGE